MMNSNMMRKGGLADRPARGNGGMCHGTGYAVGQPACGGGLGARKRTSLQVRHLVQGCKVPTPTLPLLNI
jgi:hypothetical protein